MVVVDSPAVVGAALKEVLAVRLPPIPATLATVVVAWVMLAMLATAAAPAVAARVTILLGKVAALKMTASRTPRTRPA